MRTTPARNHFHSKHNRNTKQQIPNNIHTHTWKELMNSWISLNYRIRFQHPRTKKKIEPIKNSTTTKSNIPRHFHWFEIESCVSFVMEGGTFGVCPNSGFFPRLCFPLHAWAIRHTFINYSTILSYSIPGNWFDIWFYFVPLFTGFVHQRSHTSNFELSMDWIDGI